MRLLPAMIIVVLTFAAGLLFLQRRSVSGGTGVSGAPSRQMRKAGFFMATVGLLALFGILFMFLGKIALLIALLVLAVFFLSSRKA